MADVRSVRASARAPALLAILVAGCAADSETTSAPDSEPVVTQAETPTDRCQAIWLDAVALPANEPPALASLEPVLVQRLGRETAGRILDGAHQLIPEDLLPVRHPDGAIQVPTAIADALNARTLTPESDFETWRATGLYNPRDRDHVRAAARHLATLAGALDCHPTELAWDEFTGGTVQYAETCPECDTCKATVTVTKDLNVGHNAAQGISIAPCQGWQNMWATWKQRGAFIELEADGGTTTAGISAPSCTQTTGTRQTATDRIRLTFVTGTEGSCPKGVTIKIRGYSRATQNVDVVANAKFFLAQWGWRNGAPTPWLAQAHGGAWCRADSSVGSVSASADRTVKHWQECTTEVGAGVGLKAKNDEWVSVDLGNKTSCRKNLGMEDRAFAACHAETPSHELVGGGSFSAAVGETEYSVTAQSAQYDLWGQSARATASSKTTAATLKIVVAGSSAKHGECSIPIKWTGPQSADFTPAF